MNYPSSQVFPPLDGALPFEETTDPAANFRSRGYAFFPGLLDRTKVLRVRRALLEIAGNAGWLDPSASFENGLSGPQVFGENSQPDDYFPVYRQVQECEPFHALGHEPALVDTIKSIVDEPVLPLPLKMARYTFPTSMTGSQPTPHHQDYFFIQGSHDFVIAWVSMGDLLGADSGRLAVLSGSHQLGLWGADWEEDRDPNIEVGWRTGDFRAGDVLIFHCLTVHMSEHNLRDTIRLSADYRFQRVADPVAPHALEPHYNIAPWKDIYQGWTGQAPQWYWKELELETAPLVETLSDLRGQCRPRLVA